MAKMEPVVIKARDGFKLVSYLTLPVGSQGEKIAAGAECPRRAMGARRLGLQPRGAVVRQPRLRLPAGQFPRFGRLRQEVPPCRRQAVGRRHHAARPDRRRQVGHCQGHRRCQEDLHLRRFLRRLRHPGRPGLHSRTVCLRRRYRRPFQHQDVVRSRSRPTGRR